MFSIKKCTSLSDRNTACAFITVTNDTVIQISSDVFIDELWIAHILGWNMCVWVSCLVINNFLALYLFNNHNYKFIQARFSLFYTQRTFQKLKLSSINCNVWAILFKKMIVHTL